MKSLFLNAVAVGFFVLLSSAWAQTNKATPNQNFPRTPEGYAEYRTQYMTTQVGLTSAQRPKVQAILLEQEKQMAEFKRRNQRYDYDALRLETYNKLRPILTPEQYEKLLQGIRLGKERASNAVARAKLNSTNALPKPLPAKGLK